MGPYSWLLHGTARYCTVLFLLVFQERCPTRLSIGTLLTVLLKLEYSLFYWFYCFTGFTEKQGSQTVTRHGNQTRRPERRPETRTRDQRPGPLPRTHYPYPLPIPITPYPGTHPHPPHVWPHAHQPAACCLAYKKCSPGYIVKVVMTRLCSQRLFSVCFTKHCFARPAVIDRWRARVQTVLEMREETTEKPLFYTVCRTR